mgnify:FL=1
MSAYFISTNLIKVKEAAKELSELYGKTADIYNCGKINIAISAAYKNGYILHSFGENRIFIIGTIFNKDGFGQEIFTRFTCYEKFITELKNSEQKFFGHYVVICMDVENQSVEVIPDRMGLINTYYANGDKDDYYISNDVLLVSKYSENTLLYRQAVYEFVLLEANVGVETIFENVFRIKLGNELLLTNDMMQEKEVYKYFIEQMDRKTYLKRITEYFSFFNNYKKRIASDISAGYDTRLILSIANEIVDKIKGFSAKNDCDGGVDEEISKIITDRLHIDCYFMESYDNVVINERDKKLVLHGSSALRDSNNSGKWGHLFRERYKHADLILGGYGGEIMRAKYNRYSDIKDFIEQYYKGNEAEKICKFVGFKEHIQQELDECVIPENLTSEMIQNWYYAAVQMRIWGSGYIQMSNLYGDVVHPFMDWYLMNPIFGFGLDEVKDAKLQQYVIDSFAPELKDVPINCHMGGKVSFKEKLKRFIHYHKTIRNVATLTYCRLRNYRQNSRKNFKLDILPPCNESIDWESQQHKLGKAIASRTQSIVRAYQCVRDE